MCYIYYKMKVVDFATVVLDNVNGYAIRDHV